MNRSLAATLALVVLAAAPLALAQSTTAKPKKKGAKPAASASASASASATDTAAPAPAPTDSAAPSASAAPAATDGAGGDETKVTALATPAAGKWDSSDTREDPTKAYYFIGLRYRGTVIPKFLVNMFVNEGSTFYSNTVGAELDIRKDAHSTVLWLGYTGLGFGDTLFFQKGKPDEPDNYSIVSSSLWALFLGLDEMWSTPLDTSHHWDFEYGFGVGLGFVFGTLTNDWAYQTTDKTGIQGSNGNYYAKCAYVWPGGTQAPPANANLTQYASDLGNNCYGTGHSASQVNKVGNYAEPNWFGGGSVPAIFPQIYFPAIGVRFKPVKEFEGRLGLGFSLTGFWFGISGDYGLEKPPEPGREAPAKSGETHGLRGML